MGKKGSWFSAIKRVFTHSTKEKPTDGSGKKSGKEKKKGKGILSHGETKKSFIPLFREPSSIEKLLGEADQLLIRPPTSSQLPITPTPLPARPISTRLASPKAASPKITSPKIASPKANSPRANSPRAVSPRVAYPRAVSPRAPPKKAAFTAGATSSKAGTSKITKSRKDISYAQRPEPTLRNQNLSATTIQAAYRGYLARRSFRALKGLVRLQGVVRGQNVKRQTMNAMKQMQLLVRVQTQIQSRRIQMLENQALQHRNDKEVESTLSKWTFNQLSEAGQNGDWDDSLLKKEEAEERLRKKVEAVIKRERAMAYAYSHQLWKANPKSTQSPLDIRANGFPWWWNWLERQLPQPATSQAGTSQSRPAGATTPNISTLTPPRPTESLTPRSSRSAIPASRAKHFQSTPSRTPPSNTPLAYNKHSKTRASAANSAYDLKDDDSLVSCPPFSVPNYMTPTVSAKAKSRANSNPKERFFMPAGSESSKRRFSFPLTPQNIASSFKWNKGSNRDSPSQMGMENRDSSRSIGDFSVDSMVSMPALVGRKPFNRFV